MPRKKKIGQNGSTDDDANSDSKLNPNSPKDKSHKLMAKFEDKEEPEEAEDDEFDDSEEDSFEDPADEDEIGEADNPQWEKEFLQLLPRIAKKDPVLYKKEQAFFHEVEQSDKPSTKSETQKPLRLTEYVTGNLMETEGKEIDEKKEIQNLKKKIISSEREEDLPLVEQQRRAKAAFLEIDENDDNDDFFSVKQKSKSQIDKENKEYEQFSLTTGKELDAQDNVTDTDLLNRFWEAKELDDNEKFLRDYVLKKKWLETDGPEAIKKKEMEKVDKEDEEHLDQADEFEAKFNFRFEEPGSHSVVSFPRSIDDSARRKDEKRKKKREAIKEKEEAKKKSKAEEIKRLKNIKKEQIMQKMKEIQEITGNNDLALDLDAEFDPYTYDKQMSALFDDDYYNREEEDIGTSLDDPSAFNAKSGDSELARKKEELQASLEEFFNLDYEDLIGGEIPTRFKYTQVPADDFGLTIDEILATPDADLNKKVAFKAYAPYRKVAEVRQYVKVPRWHSKQFKQWKQFPGFANNKKEKGASSGEGQNKKRKFDNNNEGGQKKQKPHNNFNQQNRNKHTFKKDNKKL